MAKKKQESVVEISDSDNLSNILVDALNSKFKDYKIAYFLTEDAPTNIKDWVSTGNDILDLIISNRKHGGVPTGRISLFGGLEASGKSLLAAHLLASTQRKGGVAVYIDTETATAKEFLQAIGVDLSKLVYCEVKLIEDVFEIIETLVEKIRSSNKDRLVTIVVDSVAATTTKIEQESNFDKDGWSTGKAIVISKAMRKITDMIGRNRIALVFTNQLRDKLGVSFGDTYTMSGGRALPFHSSLILRLKAVGTLTKGKDTVGIKCKALVLKSRMGPPLRTVEYDMLFSSGIDNYGSWLSVLKVYELIKLSGAWYSIIDHKGEEIKFQSKTWAEMLDADPEFKEYVYNLLADAIIMQYRPISEVELDELELETLKGLDGDS